MQTVGDKMKDAGYMIHDAGSKMLNARCTHVEHLETIQWITENT